RAEGAQAGVPALQLLHGQAVGHVVGARAAVTVEVHAEEAEFAEARRHLRREGSLAVVPLHHREEFLLHHSADSSSHELLLVGKEVVEAEEIGTEKRLAHSGLPGVAGFGTLLASGGGG